MSNNLNNIQWAKWSQLVNTHYLPILKDKSRNIILYGGRSSGKSNFVAKWLLFKCLNDPYFKCILVRAVADTIKTSNFQEIRSAIEDLGLQQFFKITENPLQIKCSNGNGFIARGMSDISKIKGVSNVSCIWFDEEFPKNIEDFITISTSVRTPKADCKLIFTINPEVEEANFQDNYFYKLFFANNPTELSFTNVTTVDIGNNKTIDVSYTCLHSTYVHNRWTTDAFKAEMLSLQRTNPQKYVTYCLGLWGNKDTGNLYHKHFSRAVNSSPDIHYNPELALFLSVDFNVNPYCSGTIWQIKGKEIYCIDEIAVKTPNNNTKGICKEFMRRYANHRAGLFVMGDCNGKNKDTRSEAGHNDYKIIDTELNLFKPTFRIPSRNPSVVMRGNFINTLFLGEFQGFSVIISDKCVHLLGDLLNLKEDVDGGTLKEKTNVNGITFEKWGHHSDTLAYFLCEALKNEYSHYQNGSPSPKPIFGYRERNPNNSF